MKKLIKLLPWFFLALFTTEIVVVMLPKHDKDGVMNVREFGRLPVLLNGRIQPFDSVARNTLLQIRSSGDAPLELLPSWQFWRHPKKLRSTEWLLEVLFKPEVADTRPIFLIHHPDILSELKLGDKGLEKSGLRYYTFKEIEPVLEEIRAQGRKAAEVEQDAQRTPYQRQILKLLNAVTLYDLRLKNSIQPEGTHDFAQVLKNFPEVRTAGMAAFRAERAGETHDAEALQKFSSVARMFQMVEQMAYPIVIPPDNHGDHQHDWQNVGAALSESIRTGEIHPAAMFFARMGSAYHKNDVAEFNSAVAGYKNWLTPKLPKEIGKGRAEYYFNQVKAFLHATIIYIFAFVLAGGALLTYGTLPNFSEALRRSAAWLIGLAFIVHTFGLIFRMALEGRPPVTNLYSSAVFIGWGACVLGIVLERVYKAGLGSAVAAFAGFVTLLIAHNLAMGGDTMEMLQAVLDTNFWLATHVVVVTLGYASTFVAGLLALAYIILGVFTPNLSRMMSNASANVAVAAATTEKLDPRRGKTTKEVTLATGNELGKNLARMVYAIVCFATLFSFVGTVLGGIWADQSWGRFWGWDPKENGALLIVLWNAIILHARWGGLVRDRGLMNLAVFGNIITAFSWFGTNMLGIGLHSYGFMDAAFKWLMLFNASQLAIICLGLLPLHIWKSFQSSSANAANGKPAIPASA